jgi:hypothetical protein
MLRVLVCLPSVFLSLLTLCVVSRVVQAEGPAVEVRWSDPINLSNTLTSSYYPAVAADPYGNVHVFWIEDEGGMPVKGEPARNGNAVYHTMWDGSSWSPPVDVVFDARGTMSYPWAVIDDTGIIHLVWRSFFGLQYSRASALSAISARAWSRPRTIVPSRGDCAHLVSGEGGTLHLVYAHWEDARDSYKDGNVYYLSSPDGGLSWSSPVRISEISDSGQITAGAPRLAIDHIGRLHVVWYEAGPPDWLGNAIFYARSLDHGRTWSSPRQVYLRTGSERWAAKPNVAAIVDDEIHLVWVCGEAAHRCHQWSSDGGQTWSPPQRLFGTLHSLAGWDAVAVDGAGYLFWVIQLRYPSAMYYSYWDGARWLDPPRAFITEGPMASGHLATMITSRGNMLALVLQHETGGEVYFSFGYTSAPYEPPLPTPTLRVEPVSMAASDIPDLATFEKTPILMTPTVVTKTAVRKVVVQASTSWPIFVGLASGVTLLITVMIFVVFKRGKV